MWALFSFIPSLKTTVAEQAAYIAACVARGETLCMIPTGVAPWMYIVAILIALVGLQQLVSGITYRAYAEVACGKCKMRVVGKKVWLGIRCPTGNHFAVHHAAKVGLLIVLVVILIAAWPKGDPAQAQAPQRRDDEMVRTHAPSTAVPASEAPQWQNEPVVAAVVATASGCTWDPGWDDGFIKAECAVYNPANRARNGTIKFRFSSGKGRNLDKQQGVALAPGERKTVSVKIYEANEGDVPGSTCTCSPGEFD